jgi:aminoglycoside phosphotransferase (APT) family kinase protein
MDLKEAALACLADLDGAEDLLQALYLQPDRAVFLAERARIVLKVYAEGDLLQRDWQAMRAARSAGVPTPEPLVFSPGPPAVFAMRQVVGQALSSAYPRAAREAGIYLARFHGLGAQPPFSTGESTWDGHILAWLDWVLKGLVQHRVLSERESGTFQARFMRLRPALAARSIGLLHGDLQPVHILVDPGGDRVVALLDFADAQPGDPLLDIAVLTLWDEALTTPLLAGHAAIADDAATRELLAEYRLLRHLSEIPWLLERGYTEYADRNIAAVRRFLASNESAS